MATTEQKFLDYPGLEYYHQQNIVTMDEKDVSVLDNSKSYTDSSVQAKGNELGTRIDNLILNAGDSSAECADARVTKDGTVHDTLKNRLDTEYSQLSSEIEDINSIYDVYKNMVSMDGVSQGYYYGNQYLDKIENPGYTCFPFIALKPNTIYTLLNAINEFSWVSQDAYSIVSLAHYLNKVGSITNDDGSITFTTTDTTTGIYITCGIDSYTSCMLDESTKLYYEYIPYGKEVVSIPNLENTDKVLNELYVSKLYTSDTKGYNVTHFSSIVSAVSSIKDSNKNNEYNIYIDSGEYFVFEELGGSEYISSISTSKGERQGLVLPDYVNLIGMGKVILNGVVSDDISTVASTTCISPLNMWKHNSIENIDIIAQNTRYCIHCESNNGYSNSEITINNCHCEHLGNNVSGGWFSTQAFGGGSGSGAKFIIKNSSFKSEQTQGFSLHTNYNQKSNIIDIDGCYFVGGGENPGIVLTTYGDNTEPCKAFYKNSISTPNPLNVGSPSGHPNVWDVYDYVSNTVTLHDE